MQKRKNMYIYVCNLVGSLKQLSFDEVGFDVDSSLDDALVTAPLRIAIVALNRQLGGLDVEVGEDVFERHGAANRDDDFA